MPQGTNGIFLIVQEKHLHKKGYLCSSRVINQTFKDRKYRSRVSVGGDPLHYEGVMPTTPAMLSTVKTRLNIAISTNNARHLILDIKDYYCGDPKHEHVQLSLTLMIPKIVKRHNLQYISVNDRIFFGAHK